MKVEEVEGRLGLLPSRGLELRWRLEVTEGEVTGVWAQYVHPPTSLSRETVMPPGVTVEHLEAFGASSKAEIEAEVDAYWKGLSFTLTALLEERLGIIGAIERAEGFLGTGPGQLRWRFKTEARVCALRATRKGFSGSTRSGVVEQELTGLVVSVGSSRKVRMGGLTPRHFVAPGEHGVWMESV